MFVEYDTAHTLPNAPVGGLIAGCVGFLSKSGTLKAAKEKCK